MKLDLLQTAANEIKTELETAISTATYNGSEYANGQMAKEALIRIPKFNIKHL